MTSMEKMQFIIVFIILYPVHCKLSNFTKLHQQIVIYVNEYYRCDEIFLFDNPSSEHVNSRVIFVRENTKLGILEAFKKAKKPLIVFVGNENHTKFQLIASSLHVPKLVFLFFIDHDTNIQDFFGNIYFPYEYTFIISQRTNKSQYQERLVQVTLNPKKNSIVTSPFAIWNKQTQIESFSRPEDILSNRVIHALLFHNPPLSYAVNVNGKIKSSGYVERIAKILETQLSFKFSYNLTREVGLFNHGRWSGGLGLLMNHSADIFLTPLVGSPDRNKYFDYTMPLLQTNIAVFIKKPDNTFTWSSFFKPFDFIAWCVIWLTIVVMSIMMIGLEYYKKIDIIRRLRKKSAKIPKKCFESFFQVCGAMCNQSLTHSNFNPMRVYQLTVHITALLILTFYSAVFLSIITAPEFKLPFTSLKELDEDGRYKLGSIKAQPWYIFQQSTDQVMQKMYHTHIKTQNPIPATLKEGHMRMCKDDKYAFVTIANLAYSHSSTSCTLLSVERISEVYLSLVLPNNSPYTKIFDKYLLKMHENGVLKKIERDTIPSSKKIEETWKPIEGLQVLSILLILLGFMILSIAFLFIEIFVYQKMKCKEKC